MRPSSKAELFRPPAGALQSLYEKLRAAYGEQPWWPAESPFEVVVGAVLTQNAAWTNVERAIARLKSCGLLSLDALLAVDHATLAETIRPSGYYNVKAKRLRNLCEHLADHGGIEGLSGNTDSDIREGLLAVNGIGPETADDILLYAMNRPVFVIDTYTRRLLQRNGLAHGDEPYDVLRVGFENALSADVFVYQQFHALIVIHAKASCRKSPACEGCVLLHQCPKGQQHSSI